MGILGRCGIKGVFDIFLILHVWLWNAQHAEASDECTYCGSTCKDWCSRPFYVEEATTPTYVTVGQAHNITCIYRGEVTSTNEHLFWETGSGSLLGGYLAGSSYSGLPPEARFPDIQTGYKAYVQRREEEIAFTLEIGSQVLNSDFGEGSFTCKSSTTGNSFTHSVISYASRPPVRVKISPNEIAFAEGDGPQMLSCDAEGRFLNFTLTRAVADGDWQMLATSLDGPLNYTVNRATPEINTNGDYVCRVANPVGAARDSIQVFTYAPPKGVNKNQAANILSSTILNLTAMFEPGYPLNTTNITWLKGEESASAQLRTVVKPPEKAVLQEGQYVSTLMLSVKSVETLGRYLCIAVNEGGGDNVTFEVVAKPINVQLSLAFVSHGMVNATVSSQSLTGIAMWLIYYRQADQDRFKTVNITNTTPMTEAGTQTQVYTLDRNLSGGCKIYFKLSAVARDNLGSSDPEGTIRSITLPIYDPSNVCSSAPARLSAQWFWRMMMPILLLVRGVYRAFP